VKDEIYINGGQVLPHKSIGASVPEPQIIMWVRYGSMVTFGCVTIMWLLDKFMTGSGTKRRQTELIAILQFSV
jgi:hypothetical protein